VKSAGDRAVGAATVDEGDALESAGLPCHSSFLDVCPIRLSPLRNKMGDPVRPKWIVINSSNPNDEKSCRDREMPRMRPTLPQLCGSSSGSAMTVTPS
jgi:hypothetical protein